MRAAKADTNQAEIVRALRAAGASVQHLHTVGKGCPDLLVGFRGVNFLFELKSPGGKLTPDEALWHRRWNGSAAIAWSVDDALEVIGY